MKKAIAAGGGDRYLSKHFNPARIKEVLEGVGKAAELVIEEATHGIAPPYKDGIFTPQNLEARL